MWTPGYWAWDPDYGDYYWVPGTWVEAPQVGYLWTPGYWGWGGGGFLWHEGYWGSHVGFYGGINYGFGFFGNGFEGGRWQGKQFFYNRNVTNVNATFIHNVYSTTVISRTTVNRISYNGGEGASRRGHPTGRSVGSRAPYSACSRASATYPDCAGQSGAARAANHGSLPSLPRPGRESSRERPPSRPREPERRNHPPANRVATAPRGAPPTHASELQPHPGACSRLHRQSKARSKVPATAGPADRQAESAARATGAEAGAGSSTV